MPLQDHNTASDTRAHRSSAKQESIQESPKQDRSPLLLLGFEVLFFPTLLVGYSLFDQGTD